MGSPTRTVNVKFDGDSKGLGRAANEGERDIDRLTRNVDKKFRDSGDKSGKSFFTGLKKWFSPSALGEAGNAGGTVFGSGFLGALKTPVLGPAIAGALVAAVAVAAPAVGAVAASGIALAFGAGIAGLGLIFAAKSQPVKDAWSKTLDSMGADMTRLSKPFESTLISIAGFADRTFQKFKPSLEAVFKEMAPVVTTFVDQVSKGLEQLQPAVRPLAEAFNAVLGALGPATQSAIGKVSKGLQTLSESVKANPEGLADMTRLVGNLTEGTLNLITALNNADGAIKRFENNPKVSAFLDKTGLSIGGLANTTVNNLVPGLGLARTGLDQLAGSADKASTAVGLTGDAAKYFTQGLSDSQVAAILAGNAVAGAGTQAESAAAKFDRQTKATDALIQSTFRLQNLALGLAGAEVNFQASLDAASASVKDNGKNLDINSEKGRNNKSALIALAQAANQQTQSMIESGAGTAAAGRSAENARSSFVRIATQMGLSKKEADRLATSLIGIPPNKTSNVQVNGATAAKGSVDALGRSIKNLPSTKVVTVKYTVAGIPRSTPSNIIGSAGRASGGPTQPFQTYKVGERGPEWLTMGSQPGFITSAEKGAPGNQAPQVLEVHIEVGGEVTKVVRQEIKADKRQTKRVVLQGVGS
ncbi:hypothetical protein [Kribbella jiaozuonensis]|uniref:Uncharacterized protein n=1 Tax=Kribbella jiaozuonensis TaxID=2575441 RepID=A0A4U3LWI7_9ACTN|nr:hypothetical protein [Kribbella jiaozuonensis]TKK79196.1 hypothetical protein FDA38_12260 [Kribbella jiaozuonensis]TKK83266.1 hypothetical protein FDA38_11215 [Kribbella jiaozuonensis]